MKYFTTDHDWVEIDGKTALIGVTAHAQEQIGDVVFVELPKPGKHLRRGDVAAVVESVKSAFEIAAPIAGTVTGTNDGLEADPALVNRAPEGEGWLFRLELDEGETGADLLDEATYLASLT
jgi:glycine cleavage system H protein